MLTAKLFVALAVLQLGLGLLSIKTYPTLDIYWRGTYFVLPSIHLFGLLALASAFFALIYFAAARWLRRPPNRFLSLAHFVLTTIAFLPMSVALRSQEPSVRAYDQVMNNHPLLVASVVVLSFLLGYLAFVMNCAWTAVRIFVPAKA